MTGLTAYQDSCFAELAELGNELLLVYPENGLTYAEFDSTQFSRTVDRMPWRDGRMPEPDELVARIDAFAPDAVIMWSWHGKGYRAVMTAMRGRALRVMFSSNFWRGTAKQYAGLLAHRVYVNPLFDSVWVPCERSELFARRIGFAGGDVIRGANSADTPLFDRGPRTGEELLSRRRFLFTGRLIWHKGPVELARAYARYRELVAQPWDLEVAGAGPLAGEFDGIDGVRVHGFVQPADLATLMHESSCLVLPSHVEWYGVVVHEGAAAGLPLIVGDGVGAAAHYVQDGFNGWTVSPGHPTELTDALVRMSTAGAPRLAAMSAGSHALSGRLSPRIWAQNLHEQLARRLPVAAASPV